MHVCVRKCVRVFARSLVHRTLCVYLFHVQIRSCSFIPFRLRFYGLRLEIFRTTNAKRLMDGFYCRLVFMFWYGDGDRKVMGVKIKCENV